MNFLFCQNFNERDSLKRIIKILNNATYEIIQADSSRRAYELFHDWKLEKDSAIGRSNTLMTKGSGFSIPSENTRWFKLFFRNGKLIQWTFSQAESKSEILILNKNEIKVQYLNDDGISYWIREQYKSSFKFPKDIKRFLIKKW